MIHSFKDRRLEYFSVMESQQQVFLLICQIRFHANWKR